MSNSISPTDAQIDEWVKTNVDTDNVDDLLDGLDGNGSDEFTVAEDQAGGTRVTYNEDPDDGILLPTESDVDRFRKRVEGKRSTVTEEGYQRAITSEHS